MKRLKQIQPRAGFGVWLEFDDGTAGEVDLADLGGTGVFRSWADRGVFEAVQVGPGGSAEWPGEIELCPDALYLRLTGLRPEELFPRLATNPVRASA